MEKIGVKTMICTDISKDGAMKGTNLQMYKELSKKYSLDIVASGGVSTIDDIKALRSMELYGAIIGKAYYTGAIKIEDAIKKIKDQIGDEKAIIALSGGVDSSVCSVLVQKAIGDNLTAIFVDHGLLREGEVEQVTNTFKDRLNFKFVDASDLDKGEVTYYPGDFLTEDAGIIYNFTPNNTSIVVEDGQVIQMTRIFTP